MVSTIKEFRIKALTKWNSHRGFNQLETIDQRFGQYTRELQGSKLIGNLVYVYLDILLGSVLLKFTVGFYGKLSQASVDSQEK